MFEVDRRLLRLGRAVRCIGRVRSLLSARRMTFARRGLIVPAAVTTIVVVTTFDMTDPAIAATPAVLVPSEIRQR
ncbi:MAG: hypothetical protein KDK06_19240 [Gammaproteobacteria bacterium]|nr:hypothetical protein [Gammaproteobacteria bacterium]